MKRGGLYVDMERDGRIRRPSEITETEVSGQLARARQVAESASLLRDAEGWLRDPPAEGIELAWALIRGFAEAGYVRTPEDAAAVILQAVSKLQLVAASDAAARSRS